MLLTSLISLLPLLLVPASALTVKARAPAPAAGDIAKLSNGARLAQGLPLRKPKILHDASQLRVRQATPSGAPIAARRSVCEAYTPSQFGQSCTAAATPGSSPGGTCCTDSPGGLLLLTQFWNGGSASYGPADSWTVHGLWPDNCDSTYEEYCDPSRERTEIRSILTQNGDSALVSYMDTFWKTNGGSDETLWAHEFNKHGTCISSLDTQCFQTPQENDALITYFQKTVEVAQTLPSFDWLAADGILPSNNVTYTNAQIVSSLSRSFGFTPVIRCSSGALDEIWYFYNSLGGIVDGSLVKTNAVGNSNDCPATGIRYLPKYVATPNPPATGPGVAGAAPEAVGVRGFVYPVYPDGSQETNTCLISAGTWYKGGTCGGYTTVAPPAGSPAGSFILRSSRGPCAISATTKQLTCAAANTEATAAVFSFTSDGEMSIGGSGVFGAGQVPSGSTQVPVFLGDAQAVDFGMTFVPQ